MNPPPNPNTPQNQYGQQQSTTQPTTNEPTQQERSTNPPGKPTPQTQTEKNAAIQQQNPPSSFSTRLEAEPIPNNNMNPTEQYIPTPETQKAENTANNETIQKKEAQKIVEHEIQDKEVQKYVQQRPQTPQVPPQLQKAGVQTIDRKKFPNYRKVELPIPDEEVVKGQKSPEDSSFRWLAEYCNYVLKKAHIKLKNVNGRLRRVLFRM